MRFGTRWGENSENKLRKSTRYLYLQTHRVCCVERTGGFMKKRILGLIAFVVALAMIITILPVNTGAVQAASKKPKLSKKSISVDIDAKETLTIKKGVCLVTVPGTVTLK